MALLTGDHITSWPGLMKELFCLGGKQCEDDDHNDSFSANNSNEEVGIDTYRIIKGLEMLGEKAGKPSKSNLLVGVLRFWVLRGLPGEVVDDAGGGSFHGDDSMARLRAEENMMD